MTDPPLDENLRARMQGIRSEIDQGLEDVSATAHRMVDWKHYVKTYPWVCLGTAAALGYLIVPKRSTTRYVDLAALTKAAGTGHPFVESTPPAPRGMLRTLLATVASMAVHRGIGFLAQNSARVLGITEDAVPRTLSGFDRASDDATRQR